MSYIDKNLTPNETVVHRSKLHWIVFGKPAFLWIMASLLGGSANEAVVGLAWIVIIFLAIPYTISVIITYLTSEFAVTDRRIIAKVGFIKRTSLETLLQKVEGIDVDQGILGRIMNYGLINVRGIGGSGKPIKSIRAPMDLRRAVYDQIEAIGGG